MKAILRSSCLCLFYLIQTFIKCLLYATQHSWSFPACHLIQSTLVQIHMPLVCNKYFFVCVLQVLDFCWKCARFWKACLSILPELFPVCPQAQGSLSSLQVPSWCPHFWLYSLSPPNTPSFQFTAHTGFLFPDPVPCNRRSHLTLLFTQLSGELCGWDTEPSWDSQSLLFSCFFFRSLLCEHMHVNCFYAVCPSPKSVPSSPDESFSLSNKVPLPLSHCFFRMWPLSLIWVLCMTMGKMLFTGAGTISQWQCHWRKWQVPPQTVNYQ